jgi:(+)-neomenthol dehydrogenase
MEGAAMSSTGNTSSIAVVTGGNKGIGLEVCRQLAGNGVAVVLTARDEKRGAEAVDKLTGLGLSDIIFHQLDITDASSISRLAEFLKSRFGRVDILVNNAAFGGIEPVGNPSFSPESSAMDAAQRVEWMRQNCRQTYDTAKECLQTNYYGVKHVTEALLPLLQSSPDGRVVNVSSGFGLLRYFRNEELKQELDNPENLTEERLDELLAMFLKDFQAGTMELRGWPTDLSFSAYKVAKAAMNAYSRILASKHPELRINCVHPGYVKTEINWNSGYLTPEEGGSRVVAVALLPAGGPTGALFCDNKETSFI